MPPRKKQSVKHTSNHTSDTVNRQLETLWGTTQHHYTTAIDYNRKREWISAYYNMQLAALACKHYSSLRGESMEVVNRRTNTKQTKQAHSPSFTLHSPPPLDAHNPVDTLRNLYELMPQYEKKIQKFQRSFGCPRAPKTKTHSSSISETDTTDCSGIRSVDLQGDNAPVYFEDLIGNEPAKQAIEDGLMHPIFLPLLYPNQAKAMLFYGPPGTGKTLLARATAFEINRRDGLCVLFFAPTADQFKGKYVGETEAKIVRLFMCASQQATDKQVELHQDPKKKHTQVKSVIFIDEIDSLARRRDGQTGASAGVVASATNTLLQVMDGIKSYDNVIVLAATNYPWNIDSAVLRRFGQKIYVPLPDEDDIVQLMQLSILRNVKRSLEIKHGSESHTRTITEQFHRWQLLHGIQEEELRVLASEMVGGAKHVGYSPRDIVRLCEHVFKNEARDALYAGTFHRIVLLPQRSNHPTHTQMFEEILQSLKHKHVSSRTFERLTTFLSHAIDVDAPPILSDTSTFPKSITRVSIVPVSSDTAMSSTPPTAYVEWNSLPKDTVATPDATICKTLHVYVEQQQPTQYVLHRSYKVYARNQTHYVPLFFHCNIPMPTNPLSTPIDATTYFSHIHTVVFIYDGRVYQVHNRKQPLTMHNAICIDEQHDALYIDTSVSWLHKCVHTLSEWLPQSPRSKANVSKKTSYAKKETRTQTTEDNASLTTTTTPSSPPPKKTLLPKINTVAQLLMQKFVRTTTQKLIDITTQYRYDYNDAQLLPTQQHEHVDTTIPQKNNNKMQCVHMTYDKQSFIDAFGEVLPSSKRNNVDALNIYHCTGKEP